MIVIGYESQYQTLSRTLCPRTPPQRRSVAVHSPLLVTAFLHLALTIPLRVDANRVDELWQRRLLVHENRLPVPRLVRERLTTGSVVPSEPSGR